MPELHDQDRPDPVGRPFVLDSASSEPFAESSGTLPEPGVSDVQRWVLRSPGEFASEASRAVPGGVDTADLMRYSMMLGDDALILAHRVSEWGCRAASLSENMVLATIAGRSLGQAKVLLARAAELEGQGRDADRLAYFRPAEEFLNVRLAEIDCGPGAGGDFAATIARLLLLTTWKQALLVRLATTRDPVLSAWAARSVDEVARHRDHAAQWTIKLSESGFESREEIGLGFRRVWPLANELFAPHPVEARLAEVDCGVDPAAVREEVVTTLDEVLSVARLDLPNFSAWESFAGTGGRYGLHTSTMDFLLADMQYIARSAADR